MISRLEVCDYFNCDYGYIVDDFYYLFPQRVLGNCVNRITLYDTGNFDCRFLWDLISYFIAKRSVSIKHATLTKVSTKIPAIQV